MKDLVASIRGFLTPAQPASWQTLMLLSLFSVVIALFMTPLPQRIVSSGGWFFLITAVWWFVYEKDVKAALTIDVIFTKFFLGPWIVSTLTCVALFGSWSGFGKFGSITPPMLICIPPLAALIAIAPDFIKTNDVAKTPEFTLPGTGKRQGLVLFVLSHFLIACWIQFYFLLQGWLAMYPSILSDDFSRSAFVVRVEPSFLQSSRGRDVLNAAENELRDRFNVQSWADTERWLFETKGDTWVKDLQTSVQNRLKDKPGTGEVNLWQLSAKVAGDTYDSGAFYNLNLEATWTGPSANRQGYTVTKKCEIVPKRVFMARPNSPVPDSKMVAKLRCSDVTDPKLELPLKKV